MLLHILGIALLSIVGVGAYQLLKHPYKGLQRLLTVNDLGRLEGTLPNLNRVIVIADHVEDPQDELRDAVKANFQRGVQYLFLVSKSKAPKEVRGFFRIFEVLAGVITDNLGDHALRADQLVKIQSLPYDWPTFPYIFYELDTKSESRFLAIRGNQLKEGIAEFYTPVEPAYAHMIAAAVLSGAPEPIPTDESKFKQSDVLPIDKSQKKEARAVIN